MALKKANYQGMPSTGGRYSNAQIQALWIAQGGSTSAAPMAAAIALAESGGDPNAVDYDSNGTVDRGLFQVNSIHGALSTFDPGRNTLGAIQISRNGTDWTPWTTFHTGAYKQFLDGSSATATGTAGGGSSKSGSDGSGNSGTEIQNLSLSNLFTSPAKFIGEFLAFVGVGLVKAFADGIGDYIIRPAWNFNVRAVAYYQQRILFDPARQPWPILTTATFWGFGYALLFLDPDSNSLTPASVRRSHLARHARRLQHLPARSALIKPSKVAKRTPKKPTPKISAAPITQTGTMSTTRPVRVKVSGTHARFSPDESAAPVEGRPASRADNHANAARGEPDAQHRSRGSSRTDRDGNSAQPTGTGSRSRAGA